MMARWLNALLLISALAFAACSDASGPRAAACEAGPYLTQLPVEQGLIESVSILGQFNPPGDIFPRGQTSLALNGSGLTPLYAPADVTITSVRVTHWLASAHRPDTSDYSISFEIDACPEIFGVFHHIPVLTTALESQLTQATCETYSTESETIESCSAFVRIPTSTGTVLGQASAFAGFDFDFFDKRVSFDYIAAHRYPAARWAICVQPLFVPALRDFLLERVGRGGIRRIQEPVCGTMEIDVPGTAQGMWVVENQNVTLSFETAHHFFALAPDELSDEFIVVATAHPAFAIDGYWPLYTFRVEPTGRVNRSFADLTPDGTIHCYTPGPGIPGGFPTIISIFVAFENDGRLRIEHMRHELNQSPCTLQAAEDWSFTGAAVRLMR
jgi:hypothetical protein